MNTAHATWVANPTDDNLWDLRNQIFQKVRSRVWFELHRVDDDIAADITTKILLALPTFKGKSRLSTWVYRITHNACMDILREQQQRAEVPLEHLDFAVESKFVSLEDSDLLLKLLDRLEPAEQQLVKSLLLAHAGSSARKNGRQRQLAAELKISEQALSQRLKKLREKIRAVLEQISTGV